VLNSQVKKSGVLCYGITLVLKLWLVQMNFAIKSFELNELQLKGQIFVSSTRSSIIPNRVFRILTILEMHIKCFCDFTIQRSSLPMHMEI
jgi:hypothetical protein